MNSVCAKCKNAAKYWLIYHDYYRFLCAEHIHDAHDLELVLKINDSITEE